MIELECLTPMDFTTSAISWVVEATRQKFPDNRLFFVASIPENYIRLRNEIKDDLEKAGVDVLVLRSDKFTRYSYKIVAFDFYTYEPLTVLNSNGA